MLNKYVSILLLLLLSAISLRAEMVVTSFRYDQSDATANTRNTERFDQNGERCALIKIETSQKGFHFDVGTLGVTYSEEQTDQHPGEIWVYVPHSVRRITIQHGQLGVLRGYEFPETIKSACTYIMQLSSGTVETIVHQTVQSQYLFFVVTPADAMVEVIHNEEEETWPVSDGVARQFVPFGKYQYRISADGYHTEAGTVQVQDAEKKHEIVVKLRPNFGWLKLESNSDLIGATVYIDGKMCGTIPYMSDRIKSGEYNLRIVKPMYKSYSQNITISDNDTLRLTPAIIPNFAELTLKVANNAEIWVNDEKYGSGSWSGRLELGDYLVVTKLEGHRDRSQSLHVTNAMRNQVVTLPDPSPIYGSLQVEVLPDNATIVVDGKEMGRTPKLIPELLIGSHTVSVKKESYSTFSEVVVIREGEISKVEGELGHVKEISINVNVNAKIVVDGQDLGTQRSVVRPLTYGTHTLTLSSYGYKTISTTFEVSLLGTSTYNYTLEKRYILPWYHGGHQMETFLVAEFAHSHSNPQNAYGLMLGQTYRGSGWYIQGRSDLKFDSKRYKRSTDWASMPLVTDADGKIDGTSLSYSGCYYTSEFMATAGFVGDILDWAQAPKNRFNTFGFYVGMGYGKRDLYLETNYAMDKEKVVVKYGPSSYQGFAMDFGLLGSIYGFTYKIGVSTINFRYLEAEVGIGWMF